MQRIKENTLIYNPQRFTQMSEFHFDPITDLTKTERLSMSYDIQGPTIINFVMVSSVTTSH